MIYPSTASYPSGTAYPEFGSNIIVTNDENAILFIPQFTFIDDAVTIPFKNVESSDSAILSESIAPFVFEPRSDSLSFSDFINLEITLDLFDSALVSDQTISIDFESIDSLSIQEFISPISVSGPQDDLTFGDNIQISLSALDSTTFEDAATIGVFIEDSLTLSDFVNFISFAQNDEATATESALSVSTFVEAFDLDEVFLEYDFFVTADPPGTDHLNSNDFPYYESDIRTLDDPIVSESVPDIFIPVIDSGNIAEFISLSLVGADNLSIADSLSSLIVVATSQDQFIYQEFFDLSTDTNAIDSGSITDNRNLEVDAVGNQPITFEEQVSITVSVADSGNLTEIIQNAVSTSDSLQLIENKQITLTQSESLILSDLANISANLDKADSSSLEESNNQISLASKQESFLLEIPFYNADYSRLDYIFLISEISSASVLKESFDYYYVTEATSNIILNGLQLITFKERTGIGKAAPLILNINDNPTVHGSVTGDIIDISVGGTEPVLL